MKRILGALTICTFAFHLASAQNNLPPKWIHQQAIVGEKCSFILIHSEGESNIRDARASSMLDLRNKVQHTDLVSVDQTLTGTSHDVYSSNNDSVTITSQQEEEGWISIKIEGLPSSIQSRRIDEFYRKTGNGLDYYALVAIPEENSRVDLSRLSVSTSYASDPATWGLSLIPGAAQIYKGAYIKGGIVIGGTIALTATALVAENLRNTNYGKIGQTHSAEVKKQYNDRANACATVRNVCLGGLAAAYIYNIVDAIVAPGARRVIVTPSAEGVGVAFNF